MKKLLNTSWASLLLLVSAFLLVYNPYTKFPYTFTVIIGYILLTVYLQNGNFTSLNFKIICWQQIKTILIVYVIIELLADVFIQPLVNKICNEPPDYSAFQFIQGNPRLYVKWLLQMWISAALGEELLFRAYAFAQLKNIFGERKHLIVLLSSLLFCLPHLYQGAAGIIMTFVFGIAFGLLYMKLRHIWVNVIVHGLIDTLFLTLSYGGYWDWYNISW
ncbi:MAG: CPBP family intramembrane metalloprotease [Bacteroidetes bacterium]|nr:CPBP family intramembrane metalloprotease [Bacteroidota bacterium]